MSYPRRSQRIRERLEREALANAAANQNNVPNQLRMPRHSRRGRTYRTRLNGAAVNAALIDAAVTPANVNLETRRRRAVVIATMLRLEASLWVNGTLNRRSSGNMVRQQTMGIPITNLNDDNTGETSTNDIGSLPRSNELAPLPTSVTHVPRISPVTVLNANTMNRLTRELSMFRNDPPEGCSVNLVEENLIHWLATINGPAGTPYEGGTFILNLSFPRDYPFNPPNVHFITRIYHCNISQMGSICMDILGKNWSPALTVPKILLSVMSLLGDPNPFDPMDGDIAFLYLNNRAQHDENARNWTVRFAKKQPPQPEQPGQPQA